MADYEQDEACRFDRVVRRLDDDMKDPDDVFFEARNRKQEIKEKMKELQSGLERNRPGRKGRKGEKKKRPKKKG